MLILDCHEHKLNSPDYVYCRYLK